MPESMKRNVAYKLRIGDINNGKQILEEERFNFLELANAPEKRIVRVNVVANIVEKFESPEKQYISLTIDDASGQIRVKIFGDAVEKFREVNQGDTVVVIGNLRYFNNELYILPEIIKITDPKYLLVRKLEIDSEKPKIVNKAELSELKDKILDLIKKSEAEGGLEADKLIMSLDSSPESINKEIQKLLEQGTIYEPRPGVYRFLG